MDGIAYLVGVDGGGTKTLVRLASLHGKTLGQASGPGSALRNGAAHAWRVIGRTIEETFAAAGIKRPADQALAVGIGIAGENVAQWSADFRTMAPAFGALDIVNDGVATLLGAHGGAPGAIVAVGTGTIGLALDIDGSRRVVDGWGFPSGDDGSGGWMGLRALHHAQLALDGRSPRGPLADAVLALCRAELPAHPGQPVRDERATLLDWLSQADQAAFARAARPVVAQAANDEAARAILQAAAAEISLMIATLDPAQRLPLALCGGLAAALQAYLDPRQQARIVAPQADAVDGALLLAQRALQAKETPA
ncbi:BadF/BadG/BcrA/BcrD ATPase family protein [Herbaspirillum seropedicae]|uniref:BadF/BadG/BcrA/BcrD ATPase family protein n=1 Tax=Herbaspirillum seropedicae TaxID=964 RepID=UPI003F8D0B2B